MPGFSHLSLNGFTPVGPLVSLKHGDDVLWVDVAERGSPAWLHAAALIQDCFVRHYGAVADVSMPFLLTLRDCAGDVLATMGMRPAQGERLFLENYLDRPVESFLRHETSSASGLTPAVPGRSGIVEVGHLAALQRGAGRPLFVAATVLFQQWQFRWVALTGTREVRSVFRRLGVVARQIAVAEPARVPGGAHLWGSYYSHAPEVMLASVDATHRVFSENGVYRVIDLRLIRQEGRHEVA